jgi:hypothetical protein
MSITQHTESTDATTIGGSADAAAQHAPSSELIAARHLLVVLKQLVRADAAIVRSAKRAVRDLQRADTPMAPSAQAGLAALRRDARTRLLVYGFARGHSWVATEPHHAEGDARLAHHLLRVWRETEQTVAQVTGTQPPLPAALRAHLPQGAA